MRVLKETNDYIAVYKPAGMPVETKRFGSMDLEHAVMRHIAANSPAGGRPYIAVINRIDQPVEGIVLFAKNQKAAASLSRELQSHQIEKTYLAVVRIDSGCTAQNFFSASSKAGIRKAADKIEDKIMRYASAENGTQIDADTIKEKKSVQSRFALAGGKEYTLQDWLVHDRKQNVSYVSDTHDKSAKKAILHYTCKKMNPEEQLALLEINLETGRHHQIRVQLAHAGMPIAGDAKYGENSSETGACGMAVEKTDTDNITKTATGKRERRSSLALCSHRLTFTDPASGEQVSVQAEPEGDYFKKMSGGSAEEY